LPLTDIFGQGCNIVNRTDVAVCTRACVTDLAGRCGNLFVAQREGFAEGRLGCEPRLV